MSTRCDHCGEVIIEDCECAVCDSDCISVDGKGDVSRPFTFAPIFDPDPDNIAQCDYSAGFGAYLPTYITDPPRCHVYNDANQSNPNTETLILSFNSERYDSDTMHDTATDNDRVIFNTAGIYVVTFSCVFAPDADGRRQATIFKNGSNAIGYVAKKATSASFNTGLSLTIQEAFEVGDTIRVGTRHNAGGALNVLATRSSPILAAKFLRLPPS